MEVSKSLTLERIRVPLQSADKTGIITELIDLLDASGGLVDRNVALEAVLKREAERTTGIGYGLAIPHGKTTGCKQLVMAAGKPAQPVDFQSLDRRPVTFVVLLVSPLDQTGPHIEALAKISSLMNMAEFRSSLDRVSTAAELHDLIATFESATPPAHL
jgi:mannitol/fructose-specific phosphotransferase system IIA component (Ntr-type)